MSKEVGREPQTIDEMLVGFLEVEEGCVEEAIIPPPEDCSALVQYTHGLAQWHLLTGLIVLVFVAMIIQLSLLAMKGK